MSFSASVITIDRSLVTLVAVAGLLKGVQDLTTLFSVTRAKQILTMFLRFQSKGGEYRPHEKPFFNFLVIHIFASQRVIDRPPDYTQSAEERLNLHEGCAARL